MHLKDLEVLEMETKEFINPIKKTKIQIFKDK